MSKETQQWLDTMIKVGYTAPQHGRGEAWHRMKGNANSYPDAVPFDEAYEMIAGWSPVKVAPMMECDDGEFRPLKTYDGKQPVAIVHSDNGALLGIHSEKYPDHGYGERLFDATSNIIDDDINIGTCGLLDGYRKAWVQIEVPDTIVHKSGESYRPFIVAMSSLDGSLSSTYQEGVTRVVCDNTLSAFRTAQSDKYKVKNTKTSHLRIADAREALGIVFSVAERFEQELEGLIAQTVSDKQWDTFLNTYIPLPEEEGRGRTGAQNKQFALRALWETDPMVAPWAGTAWGAFQAASTFQQHYSTFKGDNRVERNMVDWTKGKTETEDKKVLEILGALV